MDSGNSGGSLQSSSGGDEEYDSATIIPRPENNISSSSSSLPSFFNNFNPNFHQNQNQNQPTFFDNNQNIFLNSFSSSPNPNPIPSLQIRPRSGLQIPDLPITHPGSSSQPPLDRTIGPIRNSKKRTRASRRAPTTVLTTDTSNFRAMVQEFTGIPAPPFSGSAYSSRLNLGSSIRSGLEPFGSFLRPTVQVPFFHNNFNIPGPQNAAHSFHTLLQPQLQQSAASDFGLKSHFPGSGSILDGLGLNSGHVDVSFGGDDQDHNYGGRKVDFPLSDFHHQHDKGLDNVSSRAEGTVDSWICPSDH